MHLFCEYYECANETFLLTRFMTDLYLSGDFIAYVAEERDFMIQIRTVPCGVWGATCICGIVVMEKNDVIKYVKFII